MKTEIAADFYNNAGVLKEDAPFSERSTMLINRIRSYCEELIFTNAKILEIGCGNGRYSFAFEKMGAISTGIDCADTVIEYARDFAKQINSTSTFIMGDALDMPFMDKAFDIVFLVGNTIVEFSYDDIDKLCEQSRRVLKQTGVFCVAMNDMFIHWNGKHHDINNYSYESGQILSNYTIPGQGTYPYHAHFWTVAMAKCIFKRHFRQIDIKQTDEKRFWIECRL
ncbi:MAG: class I SAM-dependent methyltransferase [Oscillospiraceae bacterium]|jgi:ubiquinone/menaquinone biosynthesis C-methylase UbiE|nr:class I SAM-dependent methyltransferase [Oscillospiraceae bacterium]